MSDHTTPRRPIVPGPSGIAAKAIAVREQRKRKPLRGDMVRAVQPETTVAGLAPTESHPGM